MQLTNEQIEKRDYNFSRLKGRTGVIDNAYATNIPPGTRVYVYNYSPEKELFTVLIGDSPERYYCYRDEFNLIDKEFSDFKIIKKGIRVERKDKYADKFMIELLNNKRDIYLSTALVSLLSLNDEENYVGFGTDPDTKLLYVFKADKVSGYLMNKTNNRIASTADWREMNKLYDTLNFEVIPCPIIDNDNPGFIFYSVKPNYENYGKEEKNNVGVKKVELQDKTKEKKNYGFTFEEDLLDSHFAPLYEGMPTATAVGITGTTTTGDVLGNLKKNPYVYGGSFKTQEMIRQHLDTIQKGSNLKKQKIENNKIEENDQY